MRNSKEDKKFINSLHGYRTVRYERENEVINSEGRINVTWKKFVIISKNKIIFEAKKDELFIGRLMSGDGIRIKGFNLETNQEDSLTVYFSYFAY